MMSVEPGILDANILAYALNADAPQDAASRAPLDAGSPSFDNTLRHVAKYPQVLFGSNLRL
jgi:hypothetical protein